MRASIVVLGPLLARFSSRSLFLRQLRRTVVHPERIAEAEWEAQWRLLNHRGGRERLATIGGYLGERRRFWHRWIGALTRLDVSRYAGSNVIYTFHYYDPHVFTHQGMKTGAISYVSGVSWPLTHVQAQEAEVSAEQAIAHDESLDSGGRTRLREQARQVFAGDAARPHDAATIERDFDAVRAWAAANAIAPQRVLLGEFGCVLSSREFPTGDARLRWLSTVRRAAEARGFGWAYWAFKGYGGMELVDQQGALHADLLEPLGLATPH